MRLDVVTLETRTLRVGVLNYGARLVELSYKVHNQWINTILCYASLSSFLSDEAYLNAVVGPHAGRIKKGEYLDGEHWEKLDVDESGNHLHGGVSGLSAQWFSLVKEENTVVALLTTETCQYRIRYHLMDDKLDISMEAIPLVRMIINLTQHTYFTLGADSIRRLFLRVNSKNIYALDDTGVPASRFETAGTVFDFNQYKSLGQSLNEDDSQFRISKHIDHPFQIKDHCLNLYNPDNSIMLTVSFDCEFAVLYFGNYLGDSGRLLDTQKPLEDFGGIAIEPQDLPNGVNLFKNHSGQIYNPGVPFERHISYQFSLSKLNE